MPIPIEIVVGYIVLHVLLNYLCVDLWCEGERAAAVVFGVSLFVIDLLVLGGAL